MAGTFMGALKSAGELKRIALRNLARHKVKTALTCAAITVSVAAYIWMQSWIGGMTVESRRNIINYETGAAKIQTHLYFEKHEELPSYETFTGWEPYARALEEAGYDAAPRYVFSGTITSATGSAPLIVYAVDPEAETRAMAWTDYIDFGRYLRGGEFGIVLGAQTAERLGVGIPVRVSAAGLDALTAQSARNGNDADFIRSCYRPAETSRQLMETRGHAEQRAERNFVIRRDLDRAALDRLWDLFDAAGRNDVYISTVIDFRLAPEEIRRDKWEADLWPALTPEERMVLDAAYSYDELTGLYLLNSGSEAAPSDAALADAALADAALAEAALAAMIRTDFAGAVRHVNQVISAKIAGTVNSPDPANNFNAAYMPLDVLQGPEGMMLEGAVTEIIIRDKTMGAAGMTSRRETAEAIGAALAAGLAARGLSLPARLGVYTWQDYVRDYLNYENLETGATQILSFLLFFLALIGISNTMLLAILERSKEIGMMRAMGMTDGQMIFTYMMEAGFLGLTGAALGILIGCLLNIPMVDKGLDFSEMLEQLGGSMGYRVAGNFRGMWDIPVIIGSGVVATLFSACMAYFPARRVLKAEITESLRFE